MRRKPARARQNKALPTPTPANCVRKRPMRLILSAKTTVRTRKRRRRTDADARKPRAKTRFIRRSLKALRPPRRTSAEGRRAIFLLFALDTSTLPVDIFCLCAYAGEKIFNEIMSNLVLIHEPTRAKRYNSLIEQPPAWLSSYVAKHQFRWFSMYVE